LKKSYNSGGSIEFLKKKFTQACYWKGILKKFSYQCGLILQWKVDFWMICDRPDMEPNIALILNWPQAHIAMYWSKLGVFFMSTEYGLGNELWEECR
jgi:hypothetical protein